MEKKLAVRSKLGELKINVTEIMKHFESWNPVITAKDVEQIYDHMNEIAHLLDGFHEQLDNPSVKIDTPEAIRPSPKLPLRFIALVLIDAFTDGFLIGLTYSFSSKAGMILAVANTLEMSSVGISLAVTVSKCTGSSLTNRRWATVLPPTCMFLASALGAAVGAYAVTVGILYSAFVSFGVVALLALVCGELLVEARKAQGEEESWYISAMVFLGVFIVLMMNRFIP